MNGRVGYFGRRERCLHEGVREADFGSVNGAIAGGFEEGEVVGVLGVQDDAVDVLLQ